MSIANTSDCFARSYLDARQKFLGAASTAGAQLEAIRLPGYQGRDGEALYLDVALLGNAEAARLLLVTSATHGAEGYCGSGGQVSLLADDSIRARLAQADTAMLLVHAVNPYGFSHCHRTNEDNIDLNRNCIDFSAARKANPGYAGLHPLLLPASWPPTPANVAQLQDWIAAHGELTYQATVVGGQYDFPDGLFYGGTQASWSSNTLLDVMTRYSARREQLAWIDIHTGLGARGHGEKIYAGRQDAAELARAKAWWGADVFAPFDPGSGSSSTEIAGPVSGLAYRLPRWQAGQLAVTSMALEFGTVPLPEMLHALRGDNWLRQFPAAASAADAHTIREAMLAAFYCDQEDWKGMIVGQLKTSVVQALAGLKATPASR